jgi:hypothetical protein
LLSSGIATAQANLILDNFTLISQERVGRTDYNYTYRADIINSGSDVQDVTATLSSSSPYTVVVDGSLSFGDVAAGATLTSSDTFTIRQNRRYPINWDNLFWDISWQSGPSTNTAPVANAGPDQSVYVNDTVTLDGSGSSDVDGDALTYSWSFVSDPSGSATLSDISAINPTFDVTASGTYVLQLIVNDGTADSAPATVSITTENSVQLIVNDGTADSAPATVSITTENSAPVANAGPDQSVYVNDTVTLNGSGSSDVDGDALTYSWSFVSDPSGSATLSDISAVNPTFDVTASGTYVLQLIVNDGTADSAPATVSIAAHSQRRHGR